jgi:hypothetical protein
VISAWLPARQVPDDVPSVAGAIRIGQDFPTKRRCALGLPEVEEASRPSAGMARTAQPELDPRDDA